MDPVARAYEWMDEQAQLEVDNWQPRLDARFNPSSISKCPRQLYYKHTNVVPEVKPGFLQQYSSWGNFAHDQVRGVLRASGAELAGLRFRDDGTIDEIDEFKKTIEHNGEKVTLSGRGDGRIKIDGEWYYLELKSVDAGKYRWMHQAYLKGVNKKTGVPHINEYLYDKYMQYVMQSNMMCAPEMLDLAGTYLVIVNRSNCQFGFTNKDYTKREGGVILPFDAQLWENTKTIMAMVERRARDNSPPLQAYMEGSTECNQCAYTKTCWGV